MKILYEPWNLGDAIIAASVADAAPERMLLACNSKWHEVLNLMSHGSLGLLPLDLPYVWRSRRGWHHLSRPPALEHLLPAAERGDLEVISIRGDLRDWISARRCFSQARFSFSGWFPYLARRIPLLDLPFRHGLFPVRNRYRAWAQAAGVPFQAIEQRRRPEQPRPGDAPVVLHVGAQWRSRQYPQVAELAALLSRQGRRVDILGGPQDPPPPGVPPEALLRPNWPELVRRLREASFVVCNDSGPMHLAAFLGCRTLALSRCSNIAEWLPPGARALSSAAAPRGYRPIRSYWSDELLGDWPAPEEVGALLEQWDGTGEAGAAAAAGAGPRQALRPSTGSP